MPALTSLPVIEPLAPGDGRKPPWLKVRAPGGPNYRRLKTHLREWNLHTVCEAAHCPNIGECWEDATATFMILGDVCTRNCGYCAVAHGRPVWEDREEPERIGRAVAGLGLDYVVITSVNRDDLADGGAAHWATTIRAVRAHAPACRVEALIPDFQGDAGALGLVLDAGPDVLNHNTETVPRLYKLARHGGRYERALELFRRCRAAAPDLITKSGLILGLGETHDELLATMRDLRAVDVAALTLGQYLRPSAQHLPVVKYYHPDEFAALAAAGRDLGFAHVEAGPLVRSSYHAKRQVEAATGSRRVEPRAESPGEVGNAKAGRAEPRAPITEPLTGRAEPRAPMTDPLAGRAEPRTPMTDPLAGRAKPRAPITRHPRFDPTSNASLQSWNTPPS